MDHVVRPVRYVPVVTRRNATTITSHDPILETAEPFLAREVSPALPGKLAGRA
jgi:hypothetical protein